MKLKTFQKKNVKAKTSTEKGIILEADMFIFSLVTLLAL